MTVWWCVRLPLRSSLRPRLAMAMASAVVRSAGWWWWQYEHDAALAVQGPPVRSRGTRSPIPIFGLPNRMRFWETANCEVEQYPEFVRVARPFGAGLGVSGGCWYRRSYRCAIGLQHCIASLQAAFEARARRGCRMTPDRHSGRRARRPQSAWPRRLGVVNARL